MKNFHTAVLERNKTFDTDFTTHPYETAWAREAIFFIDITDLHGPQPNLHVYAQISPDGLHWIDEGSALTITRKGLHFLKVTHFGGWLRLRIKADSTDLAAETTIHLVLKE